jgi:flagellar M-ring protein FliF
MALVKTEDLMAQVQGFTALPGMKQVGLMVGLAASIALAVAVVLWAQSPNYSLLFANLSPQDLTSVTQSLDDAGVPYRLEHGSSAILVPASRVHDLRLKLAAKGLPETPESGFDLLEKDTGFGTSRFLEKARYQRALEGELAKSIQSLSVVESARVHLALPKESVFVRDRARPSASVLVRLRAGGNLSDTQVAGIVHLLAASVPKLEPEAVTVVDQRGRLLSDDSNDELALSSDQFEYNRRIEEEYRRRITEMLAPIVGASGVRAEVTADLDFTIVEQTRESYQPEQSVVRSEQIREQQNINGEPGGIPGALTNQPPRGGSLSTNDTEAGTSQSSSKEVVRNYEVDRTISHSRFAPGRVKRLSVAVMLDYRKKIGDDGQLSQTPLDEAEIARLTELVKQAVGFDASRNDSINVINMPFQADGLMEPGEELPLWQQPWLWELAKPVLGALFVLFLALGVLRPTLKNLAQSGHIIESEANAHRLPAVEGGEAVAGLPMPEDNLSLSSDGTMLAEAVEGEEGMAEEESAGEEEAVSPDRISLNIEAARSLVQQDPKRVARMVKTWVMADE